MTDEEKQAIEYFQDETKAEAQYYGSVLVNLIEKNQTRIQDLEKALIDEDYKNREKIQNQTEALNQANKKILAQKGQLKALNEAVKKQQAEIENSYWKGYTARDAEAQNICKSCKYKAEIEKKDKIIDEMAKELVKAHEWFYSEFDNYTKEDFIKYFENKVEEDK